MNSLFFFHTARQLNILFHKKKLKKITESGPYSICINDLIILNLKEFPFIYKKEHNYINLGYHTQFIKKLNEMLEYSYIVEVSTEDWDKIIKIRFRSMTSAGKVKEFVLYFEFINRYENIILTDNSGKILLALKYVDSKVNNYRQIKTGLMYKAPPQKKQFFFNTDKKDFIDRCSSSKETTLFNHLKANYFELSEKLIKIQGIQDSTLSDISDTSLKSIYQQIYELKETEYFHIDKKDILPTSAGIGKKLTDITAATAQIYSSIFDDDIESMKKAKLKEVTDSIKKQHCKLEKQKEELEELRQNLSNKELGNILLSNVHNIPKNQSYVELDNFYTGEKINIALEPDKSPQQNIDLYFKLYKKAKNGMHLLEKEIKKSNTELEKLRSVSEIIQSTTSHFELEKLLKVTDSNQSKKSKTLKLKRKTLEKGWVAVIGRSSRENDLILQQYAHKQDYWFHVKSHQGSHVILQHKDKQKEPGPNLIAQAAEIAVQNSKAKHSTNVAVDFTLVKWVRKPRKAAAGYVIYKNYKTIFITPKGNKFK